MNGYPENGGPGSLASDAGGSPEAMERVQQALTVQLIATPRRAFKTCRAGDDLGGVVKENAKPEARFDHIPVVEGGGGEQEPIIGLIDLRPFKSGTSPQGFVNDCMDPISRLPEDIRIAPNVSILDFVRQGGRHPFRFVASGSKIAGLVTLSDLQKLPVQAALFAAITNAEIAMRDAIQREFNESEEWMILLWKDRQKAVLREKKKSIAENTFVNSLLFTTFYEKMRIIHQSEKFGKFDWDQESFNSEMKVVRKLRNDLYHAKNYALPTNEAELVCRAVRSIDRWVPWLICKP